MTGERPVAKRILLTVYSTIAVVVNYGRVELGGAKVPFART
jgi:hypothetical protein